MQAPQSHLPIPHYLAALVAATIFLACQSGGGGSEGDASTTSPSADAGVTLPPDAAAPPVSTCAEEFLGSGDGCDCGCAVVDTDCPTPTSVDDCEFNNCSAGFEINPDAPSQCQAIEVPVGWTCSASLYGADGACTCGCGAFDDKDCAAPLTKEACSSSQHGCPNGQSPNPNNPTECQASPVGWTCNWQAYYDSACDCGCGVADPACPANAHISQCDRDGCASGFSPNPSELTQCIDHAPQDSWDCDLTLLNDGLNCDCGCGAIDPDCPAGATAASCDSIHCPVGDELEPDSIAECWETCIPLAEPVGNASCTNGGFFNIFNSCNRNLSACSDGRSYEVECTGGECVCRVNGNCVAHEIGSCSLNFTCGWSLIDNI